MIYTGLFLDSNKARLVYIFMAITLYTKLALALCRTSLVYSKTLNRSSTQFWGRNKRSPQRFLRPLLRKTRGATLITTATSIQGFGVHNIVS